LSRFAQVQNGSQLWRVQRGRVPLGKKEDHVSGMSIFNQKLPILTLDIQKKTPILSTCKKRQKTVNGSKGYYGPAIIEKHSSQKEKKESLQRPEQPVTTAHPVVDIMHPV